MAHDPSLGYADYFAAGGGGGSASTLVPDVDAGEPELYGLHQSGGVEMFGVRGLVPATAPAQSKAALVDDDGSSTIQFVLGEQQQHRQMSQAPLSLSLHRSAEAASSLMLHHQIGGGAPRQHQQPAPAAWMQGAWHLRGSRFLLPTQRLLHEFCSFPVENTNNPAEPPKPSAQENGGGSSSSASWTPSTQIQTMDTAELQRLKAKLYTLLEEVDRRYRRYCEQMRAVAGSFEAVAGEQSSAVYTKLASRTISRHFRGLRDGVVAQIQAVRKALGEKDTAVPGMTKGETPRLRVLDQCLRQHKAYQAGMLESQSWRPQRGLPERAVSILRAWLFEHFLHPYPSDVDKHILARQTGLSRSQVSNWFINARVRLWKPMVEEMYSEEMKDQGGSGQSQVSNLQNPNPSNYTSEGGGNDEDGGGEQKPTRAQLLHDAGSLASVVSIGSGAGRIDHQSINFGMMDHLDFHVYEAAGGQGFGGGSAGGVSLTLGLQQHSDSHGGVNVAAFAESPSSAVQGGATEFLFIAGEQQMGGAGGGVHSAHGHHSQFRAGMDGDAESHYRGLSATGFQLLHDLAG